LLLIKQIGVALAVAVLVDMTLVRCIIVPAVMTLFGKWVWWTPKPLRKVYDRFKIEH
jgi:RND superfamily putative drug exporter